MKRIYSLAEFGVTKHETTLKNGLKVIFIEKPFAPIYAKLLIRAGSIFNPSDSGLAHFTEHIIVSGSKNYPTKEEFSGIMASIGGYSNAFTGRATMSVDSEIAVKGQLKDMKKFFSEALTHIRITPDSLKKEKGVITSEIQGKRSENPGYDFSIYLNNLVANGTKWGYSTLGTVESVSAITIEDVENFFSTYCCVENMLLVIAGGCSLSDVDKTFSGINFLHGNRTELITSPLPIDQNQRIFYQQDTKQTRVGIFFQGPEIGTRESIVLRFALKYAHDGLTSRFYSKLRNQKGLAYKLFFSMNDMNRLRYFGTNVGVPNDKVDLTIEAVIECYKEFVTEGISQKQIRNKAKTEYFSEMREIQTSVDWVGEFNDIYPEVSPLVAEFPDYYNFMQTITTEEISDVLQKYITFENYHLAIHGKESSKIYF